MLGEKFTVKEVSGPDKSKAELEKEVIEQHAQAPEPPAPEPPAPEPPSPKPPEPPAPKEYEIEEEKIYSFLSKKLNKEVKSLEDLKEKEELPEEVSAFYKYKKETNRGIDDFVKLNRDFSKLSDNEKLFEYLSVKEDALEKEDILAMIKEYEVDEEMDLEADINRKNRERKKALKEADKFFEKQKEQYRLPLVSSTVSVPDEDKELFESYKQYKSSIPIEAENNAKKAKVFEEKTSEVFSDKFKGFEFKVKVDNEETSLMFAPGTAEELKSVQSTPLNFIKKYMDKDGVIADAEGYHRGLAVAMNPEKFAQFFIEQGYAMAKEKDARTTKNINMSTRQAPQVLNKTGFKVQEVDQGFNKSLKIISVKKVN